jgi:xanthine dehydrogenase small subunit
MRGSIDEAALELGREIEPIDDIRSTADYRRHVAANLLRRFWSDTA